MQLLKCVYKALVHQCTSIVVWPVTALAHCTVGMEQSQSCPFVMTCVNAFIPKSSLCTQLNMRRSKTRLFLLLLHSGCILNIKGLPKRQTSTTGLNIRRNTKFVMTRVNAFTPKSSLLCTQLNMRRSKTCLFLLLLHSGCILNIKGVTII